MHDSIEAAIIEYVTGDVAEMPDESHWPKPRHFGPWSFAELLHREGITAAAEQEMPQQVKPNTVGPWCQPAITRRSTKCGKTLAGYSLRDESYLGELCKDGCFSAFELSVLVPQAVAEAAAKKKADEEHEMAVWAERDRRWNRESAERRARSERLAAERHARDEAERERRTLRGMVALMKPSDVDDDDPTLPVAKEKP